MKNVFIIFTFLCTSLLAATADTNVTVEPQVEEVYTLAQLQDVNTSTKVHAPLFYKDFDWDVGLVGGLVIDGTQTEAKHNTLGTGIHLGYHLNEFVTFHGEVVDYFKTFTKDEALQDATNRMYVASVAFDFSADRPYSLFAKAGLGYEQQSKYDQNIDSPISLMGFGFRYLFTDRISGYVEGRWKFVLVNTETPDNSLVGTVGLDYHFGLSDEKSHLVDASDKHNVVIEERMKLLEAAQDQNLDKELEQ